MAGASPLKLRWQAWSVRFAALQPREKAMVIGATVIAIAFGGHTLWIEPAQLQAARLKKAIEQQQAEQVQVRAQVSALAAQNSDPDAAGRVALQQLREQLAGAESTLKNFERNLIAPTQAPILLQTLLTRHRGLKMLSLATLAPLPLIEPPANKEKTDKSKAEEPKKSAGDPAPAMPGGNIYKHGIEIRVAGGYHDLLAYVADLEASPQKLLWGDMRLAVKEYPVSELTLTVFTLSLDSTWLVV